MKKIFLLLLFALNFTLGYSQQLAKAEAINSLDIILRHNYMKNPCDDIYDNIWVNNSTNCYSGLEVTHNYKIDLRDFCMPIKKNKITITSHYGYRKQFKRNHYGVDLSLNVGDTIYSTFAGKIRVVKNDPRGYGKYVVIRHFNGLETIYAHMSKQLVKENEYVYVGQPIGLGGNTGRSTGPHLHIETKFCGRHINPLKIFDFKFQDVTGDSYEFL